MILDYHMHLEADDHGERCRFTPERIRLYAEHARVQGAREIGISEHCNRFAEFRPVMEDVLSQAEGEELEAWYRLSFRESLDAYVEAVLRAKAEGLPVKLSIEVDYIPGKEKVTREILARYPFDYVIGSVHFIGTWGIDVSPEIGWPEADVDRAYQEYFRLLEQAARSGLFDILAHPDLVKKFGHRPSYPLDELYDAVARAAKESGAAAEISSAGLYKPVGELYPAPGLLERFFDRGVPVTLGSDAHAPEHAGRGLHRAAKAAAEAGFRTVTRFDGRRPTQVELG